MRLENLGAFIHSILVFPAFGDFIFGSTEPARLKKVLARFIERLLIS